MRNNKNPAGALIAPAGFLYIVSYRFLLATAEIGKDDQKIGRAFGEKQPRANIRWPGVNPKFCVNSIYGANRAKFIQGGSRGIRLPPFQQHNAGGGGCQGRRSRSPRP